jgi:hypothetical protein
MTNLRSWLRPLPFTAAGLLALAAAAASLPAGAQTGLSPAQDPFFGLASKQAPADKLEGLSA